MCLVCVLQIFELNGSNVGVQVSRISSLLYGICIRVDNVRGPCLVFNRVLTYTFEVTRGYVPLSYFMVHVRKRLCTEL